MDKHGKKKISRKDFIKKTSAGLLSIGLLKGNLINFSDSRLTDKKSSSEYRKLGRTGIEVTPLGYGASRTMEPTLVKSALNSGINFLDTGRSYFSGQNEVMVGKVIKGIRQEVIVQSKIGIDIRDEGERLHSSKVSTRILKIMESSLTDSLKALQTDYIDVVLIHGADSVIIINHEAIMSFFQNAKKMGQIRACGFSSHSNHVKLLEAANKSKFYDVIMIPYNHKGSYTHSRSGRYNNWDQSALEIGMEQAEKNNIGIVAMKTCSGGSYSPDGESEPTYKAALKWILDHSYINTTATAMGNVRELTENIQVIR